ncbi:MAG TPA: hypothetical protein VL866_24495 [Pyrinomonadaceae bacterium]|nr:hypothetical protein [Pyrinomonadaceae bacterium]
MERITYISEQDRDYAKSLKAAQTHDALKAHVSAWRSVADDAFKQVAAESFDFAEFQEGRKKESRNEYAGDGWAMKYGAILMPEIMIRVCVVAQQYGAPWGCAYIRLKEAGVIDDSSGIAVWKEHDDSSNDIS